MNKNFSSRTKNFLWKDRNFLPKPRIYWFTAGSKAWTSWFSGKNKKCWNQLPNQLPITLQNGEPGTKPGNLILGRFLVEAWRFQSPSPSRQIQPSSYWENESMILRQHNREVYLYALSDCHLVVYLFVVAEYCFLFLSSVQTYLVWCWFRTVSNFLLVTHIAIIFPSEANSVSPCHVTPKHNSCTGCPV